MRAGFLEEEARLPFRLADPLGEDVGAFAHEGGCGQCQILVRKYRKNTYLFDGRR
jgi:hypothetical protein